MMQYRQCSESSWRWNPWLSRLQPVLYSGHLLYPVSYRAPTYHQPCFVWLRCVRVDACVSVLSCLQNSPRFAAAGNRTVRSHIIIAVRAVTWVSATPSLQRAAVENCSQLSLTTGAVEDTMFVLKPVRFRSPHVSAYTGFGPYCLT